MAPGKETRNPLLAFLASDHNNFLLLLLTTPISIVLLSFSVNDRLFMNSVFKFVVANRPTVQFAVQIIANVLATFQIIVLCRLINFTVRRHLTKKSMELDHLRAWNDAMVPRVNWDLPFEYGILLLAFVSISMIFSAIWAAALTPVEVSTNIPSSVTIPGWQNTSLIREYPSEVGKEGPTQQTIKGRFTYSPGIQLLGTILAGATSATPIDRSARVHAKWDNSRYSYIGRSYGVGASVGLTDDEITSNDLALGYSYQEIGYNASVKCIYNASSDFTLQQVGDSRAAVGTLPDSDSSDEWSEYFGHSMSDIVAIGVAHFPNDLNDTAPVRKYIGFTSGLNYAFLNTTQCEVIFTPAKFNVTVNISGRNITVTPTNETDVEDIDPSRFLKGVLLRQFELISNDETNLYVSMVGAAFNGSVTDYRTSIEAIDNPDDLTDEEMTLKGIENSITVMTDDMLAAYASAQLMISKFNQSVPAESRVAAIAFGETNYCIAVFAVNAAVILLFAFEALRTRWWRGLPKLNIADLRHLVVAASEGGSGLGRAGFGQEKRMGKLQVKCSETGEGRFAIFLDGEGEKTPMVEYSFGNLRWDKRAGSPPPPGMI